MKVNIGVSARHVHLSEEDFNILFPNNKLEVYKELSQYPNFASTSQISLKNGDRIINNVRVIGPFRDETQVELSKTDCYFFKIDAPLCNSSDLTNAAEIELISENASIKRKCVIIQNRHIHISPEEASKYGFTNDQTVRVKIDSVKGGIMDNVHIKVGDKFKFELQLDTDDANAFMIDKNSEAEILND